MDYNQMLDQLRSGELNQFIVTAKEFSDFYNVWRDYPYQNAITGTAERGGIITYTAKNDEAS